MKQVLVRRGRPVAATALAVAVAAGGLAMAPVAQAQPVVAATRAGATAVSVDGRSVPFNDGWKFVLDDPAGAEAVGFDDGGWAGVQVPHDWSIHEDFNLDPAAPGYTRSSEGLLPAGTGWYRKEFTLPKGVSGKEISLDFDGVMGVTTVFLNGTQLTDADGFDVHNYGYTPFSYDIGDLLDASGENVLAVRVENVKPNSRWYTGSGIYRDVTLTVTDPVHVARNGSFVTTPTLEADVAAGVANVSVATTVENDSSDAAQVSLSTRIVDADGNVVATGEAPTAAVEAGTSTDFAQTITVEDPKLWSTEDPNLYDVVTQVRRNGAIVDVTKTTTGLRSIRFDTTGFYLNGEPFVFRGMNLHHDLGALGTAVDRSATRRQLEILKEAGVNSVRISHNPASRVLIEEAEKLGLALVEEAFDQWRTCKTTNDYHQYFPTDAEKDIKSMVERDKNSPAIVLWSTGNEIATSGDGSCAVPISGYNAGGAASLYAQDARNLNDWVKEVDTTRPTTWGEAAAYPDPANVAARNAVDIPGVNYTSESGQLALAQTHKNKVVLGTEVSWGMRSRGYYYNPSGRIFSHRICAYFYNPCPYPDIQDSWQGSSYDNQFWVSAWDHVTTSGSSVPVAKNANILGAFLWSGFDYFGETLPWEDTSRTNSFGDVEAPKNSYSGAVDTAGFPKDLYYLYQALWTDEPVLHLLPHWNWEDENPDPALELGDTGKAFPGQVWAYTNADTVKLYLNDELVGERSFETRTGARGDYQVVDDASNLDKVYLSWDLEYEPGTLRAEAYTDGELVATEEISTSGAPAKVALSSAEESVGSGDLVFVEADIQDKDGLFVPYANDKLTFTAKNGTVVGVDNGNSISTERYADSNVRRAFSGKALVIVRPDGSGKKVEVCASAEDLKSDCTKVEIDAAPVADKVKPGSVLVAPAATGPFRELQVQVDASDDQGLNRVVANIYRDGKLVESTQTPAFGATAWSHVATVSLPDGTYTIKYSSEDLAGNVSKTGRFDVTIGAATP
ncbi:glycoside hydrolase family 2 TIM barrel-domain containing protein [Agromyces sp. NPDC056523]|uniref:glycoside hydrolase family 2 TIM barrel-domain containing protein n=1 Tax=Agromyces sp. NPDC056523 TaxID=3345850 RepID=UPI003671C68B